MINFIEKLHGKYHRYIFLEDENLSESKIHLKKLKVCLLEKTFQLKNFLFIKNWRINGIDYLEVDFEKKFLDEIFKNQIYFFRCWSKLDVPVDLEEILQKTCSAVTVVLPRNVIIPENYLELLCQWKRTVPLNVFTCYLTKFDENLHFLSNFLVKISNPLFRYISFGYPKLTKNQIKILKKQMNKIFNDADVYYSNPDVYFGLKIYDYQSHTTFTIKNDYYIERREDYWYPWCY
uniref:Uncharacterized protein n=1 Tax=Panagrolaimus sp. JU765 TaxID=591449 RepID=A0AC34RE02_9BILA